MLEMRFEESEAAGQGRNSGRMVRTIVHVSIRPQRSRDRRRRDVLERAQRLAASLKSYLIAQDHDPRAAGPSVQTSVTKERLIAAADALALN
jgi:hypothetical protein